MARLLGRMVSMPELDIRVSSSSSRITVQQNHGLKVYASSAGPRGESAYQVAVDNGFVGTQDDWLDTLIGPAGPSGGYTGTAWWYGEGVPGTIVGSKVGDFYLDTETGVVYEME